MVRATAAVTFGHATMLRISRPAYSLNAPPVTLLLRKLKFCKPRAMRQPRGIAFRHLPALPSRCTKQRPNSAACPAVHSLSRRTHDETSTCSSCGGNVSVTADGPGPGPADANAGSRGQEAGLLHGRLEDGRGHEAKPIRASRKILWD